MQSFPNAAIRRLVSSGAYPRWGSGGRELFYRTLDGRLMNVPVRLVGSSVELGTPSVVMRRVDVVGVHPYPYDVAADGRILALIPPSGRIQDLTLTGTHELAGSSRAVRSMGVALIVIFA